MVDSHFEILWADKSVAGLRCHPTEYYGLAADDAETEAIITQQHLRSNMIGLWIKNSLTNYEELKLRELRSAYTFNNQDDGYAMLFIIVKIVQPDTLT